MRPHRGHFLLSTAPAVPPGRESLPVVPSRGRVHRHATDGGSRDDMPVDLERPQSVATSSSRPTQDARGGDERAVLPAHRRVARNCPPPLRRRHQPGNQHPVSHTGAAFSFAFGNEFPGGASRLRVVGL
ncbi:hypothetical protein MINT15_26290 [Saccharomonospora viridis]|uniref:Uncharacterized protein n=1 Tax=Saccharomonospora viridis TaxID=1852 RepID=A0A837D417_9PSEU|nr:hypothetical protein MINT15_26290 [Saccharomonospora viridis]